MKTSPLPRVKFRPRVGITLHTCENKSKCFNLTSHVILTRVKFHPRVGMKLCTRDLTRVLLFNLTFLHILASFVDYPVESLVVFLNRLQNVEFSFLSYKQSGQIYIKV